MACSVATCTCWTSVTSSLKILMLSYAVSSPSFSGVRMVAATFQPCFAKWSAVNLPRPLLVPVINIVLVMSYPQYESTFQNEANKIQWSLQGPQRQAPEGAQLFGARAAACRNPDSGEARREKSRGIFRIELSCNVTFG